MKAFFRDLRIATIAWLFIGFLAISGGVIFLSGMQVTGSLGQVENAWVVYQANSSEKDNALNSLLGEMGFGGLVHELKNYMLRQEAPSVARIADRLGGGKAIVRQYAAYDLSEAEQQALKDIEKTITGYSRAAKITKGLTSAGKKPAEIGAMVQIDDAPGLAGIAVLLAATKAPEGSPISKTRLLIETRAALGFGGMIHNFKDFILTGDEILAGKAKASAAQALDLLATYEDLGVSESEGRALAQISEVINKYLGALDKAIVFAREGKPSQEMEMALSINYKPVVEGMAHLTREIALTKQIKARELTQALAEAGAQSSTTVGISTGLVVFLIVFSLWLLRWRIVSPINEVTDVMQMLLLGDQVRISDGLNERNDEIGVMAAAIRKWRYAIQDQEEAKQQDGKGEFTSFFPFNPETLFSYTDQILAIRSEFRPDIYAIPHQGRWKTRSSRWMP